MTTSKTWKSRFWLIQNIYSVILQGIAEFFYSTLFRISSHKKTIEGLAQKRLRLLYVLKCSYIAFYRSRAPPSDLEIH